MAPHILQDRVVVVTGASGGVGRAVAGELGAKGAKVALIGRGTTGLAAAAVDAGAAGGIAQVFEADVADHEQLREAAGRIESDLGPIDVWINCAPSPAPDFPASDSPMSDFPASDSPVSDSPVSDSPASARFADISPEEYERTTAVAYLGHVWGTKVALDLMRPRDRGAIVQVGSALACRGIPLRSASCGAEHAVRGFTESVRTELLSERSGIRVTSVQLPAGDTPRFGRALSGLRRDPRPVPPGHQPEAAARGIVHAAAHPERKEHRVGASTTAAVLARHVAPALADRLSRHRRPVLLALAGAAAAVAAARKLAR